MPVFKGNEPAVIRYRSVKRMNTDCGYSFFTESLYNRIVQPADRTMGNIDPVGFSWDGTLIELVAFCLRVPARTGPVNDNNTSGAGTGNR
jgi:hypothetical protein